MTWETTGDEEQAFAWNRAAWDERVDAHWASKMYQQHAEALRAGGHDLLDDIVVGVGDVRGKSLIHLQCHMGMETLGWSRLGAAAVGVDFSASAIKRAEQLRDELGLDTRFICANVYDTPDLIDERFDVVFVSIGSLCWLPDIQRWAGVVSRLLNPGGFLYLNETHPLTDILTDAESGTGYVAAWPYFHDAGVIEECEVTYTDGGQTFSNKRMVDWVHPIGEVVTGLIESGLRVRRLEELPRFVWPAFEQMEQIHANRWELHDPWRGKLPGEYTLIADMPGVAG